MRAKRGFRILTGIPALVVASVVSLAAQAQYGGNSGTIGQLYQVAMAADLILLAESPGGHA